MLDGRLSVWGAHIIETIRRDASILRDLSRSVCERTIKKICKVTLTRFASFVIPTIPLCPHRVLSTIAGNAFRLIWITLQHRICRECETTFKSAGYSIRHYIVRTKRTNVINRHSVRSLYNINNNIIVSIKCTRILYFFAGFYVQKIITRLSTLVLEQSKDLTNPSNCQIALT